MAHIRNVKLQLPFITNPPYIDSKIMNEKGLIDLRAKLDTFLLRKELDKFTQHLFVIKKKKLHHLMLTPLKTRYSSEKKSKANSSIKIKMYKEIFTKSNSICNIFENVYIKQQMLLKDK